MPATPLSLKAQHSAAHQTTTAEHVPCLLQEAVTQRKFLIYPDFCHLESFKRQDLIHIYATAVSHLLLVIDAFDLRPVRLFILLSPAPAWGAGGKGDGRRETGQEPHNSRKLAPPLSARWRGFTGLFTCTRVERFRGGTRRTQHTPHLRSASAAIFASNAASAAGPAATAALRSSASFFSASTCGM